MNRATSATGWARNPTLKSPKLDPKLASSYELGYTFNPITGCLNHTDGLCKGGGFSCYAYKLAHGRVKSRYLANTNVCLLAGTLPTEALTNPFYPRLWEGKLEPLNKNNPYSRKAPVGVFVCDMSDLFGIGIPEEWTKRILDRFQYCPQHRFYLLTKQPQNLLKFSPFPDNCWVGITMAKPNPDDFYDLDGVEARIRYLSVEPMLARFPEWSFEELPVDWLIIGACTGTLAEMLELKRKYPDLTVMTSGKKWTAQPKIEWVKEIVEAAGRAGIPVFLKDNLGQALPRELAEAKGNTYPQGGWYPLRQEIPVCQ